MLLERSGQLGGTLTLGGVAFPGLFHAWGRQIIAGIGWELVTEAVALDDGALPDFSTPAPRHWQHQAVYVHGADSSTSATRTEANLAGRRALLAHLRRERTGGDARTRLFQMQPEAAFRESYRILGEALVTHDDYVAGRLFEDAICYAFYPVDLHTKDGVKPRPLAEGVIPTIPLGALVPKGSRNLMAAGRSVSSDRLANSALRVQAPCMAMGQAAGAAAALAALRNTTPLAVPLPHIRRLLREHGAMVPGP
jgi:hypothetical protein